MKRSFVTTAIFSVAIFFVATTPPTTAIADNGNAPTTMSFFSGGAGAHADWFVTADQPPGDLDRQAIRLITTNGFPTYEQGYAGILFHHVEGIPAEAFPDSEFWNKAPAGPTLGSPRLVVAFQDAAGQFTGYGDFAAERSPYEQLGASFRREHVSQLGLGRHGRPVRLHVQRAMAHRSKLLLRANGIDSLYRRGRLWHLPPD